MPVPEIGSWSSLLRADIGSHARGEPVEPRASHGSSFDTLRTSGFGCPPAEARPLPILLQNYRGGASPQLAGRVERPLIQRKFAGGCLGPSLGGFRRSFVMSPR